MSDTTPEHKQPEKKTPEQNAPEQTPPENKPAKRKRKKKVEEKDVIPNMELVLIFVFFATFIVWAVSKCTVTQASYEEEATIEETIKKQKDSLARVPKAVAPIPKPTPAVKKTAKTVVRKVTVLYVVLNGLKLRKGPTRDSMIVRQLKINEPIDFLGAVTPFKEKINMGDYIAEEPWVKVRSSTGVEGWVYGAGVSYYPPIIEEEEEELRVKNEE